jgi:hypothetical protein
VHRSSIQSQALIDVIVDWTPSPQVEASSLDEDVWTVFYDGSWGSFGAGVVVIVISPSKVKTSYAASYAAKLQF